MNLLEMTRAAVGLVNTDTAATLKRSTGYTTASDGARTPIYQEYTGVSIQVQGSMSAPELRQTEGLNLEGVMNVVYLPGNWQGVVRGDKQGGDIIQFALTDGGDVKDWLIVHILESWPDWTKVICALQN